MAKILSILLGAGLGVGGYLLYKKLKKPAPPIAIEIPMIVPKVEAKPAEEVIEGIPGVPVPLVTIEEEIF